MIRPGLVSVTFRDRSPEQIVDLARQARLEGIEWGGDVHVPHGDVQRGRHVRRWTIEAGLIVTSYGSYYRVGHEEPVPFERVLETALALQAPVVRVWAGRRGSGDADEAYRRRVVEESRRICDLALQAGLRVAYEFHDRTLTDTNESALRLLQEVAHEAIATYWQPLAVPPATADKDAYRLSGLRAVLPWLANVHVPARQGLAGCAAAWQQRLELVRSTGRDHDALLEFVEDDAPQALLREAATLRAWIEGVPSNAASCE